MHEPRFAVHRTLAVFERSVEPVADTCLDRGDHVGIGRALADPVIY
jgi:hypothetical protein